MLSKLDKQDTKEGNCWILPRQVLQTSWSQSSLSNTLVPQAEERCPSVREEPGVTVRTGRCLCYFLVWEVSCSALSVYSVNSMSFSGIWRGWRLIVIVTVFLSCDRKKLGTKLCTHQDRIDNRTFSLNLPNTNGLDIVYVYIFLLLFFFLSFFLRQCFPV